MNISCESNLNHTDVVFYENAAGQEVEDEFQGPGVSCNILTKTWFWRCEDSESILKSSEWVIKKINDMNKPNVTFILNEKPYALSSFPSGSVTKPECIVTLSDDTAQMTALKKSEDSNDFIMEY